MNKYEKESSEKNKKRKIGKKKKLKEYNCDYCLDVITKDTSYRIGGDRRCHGCCAGPIKTMIWRIRQQNKQIDILERENLLLDPCMLIELGYRDIDMNVLDPPQPDYWPKYRVAKPTFGKVEFWSKRMNPEGRFAWVYQEPQWKLS